MFKAAGDPQPVIYSVQLYRALLAAYPSEFRTNYAEPMVQVFRDACRRACREGGSVALIALWARTTLDMIMTVIEEHARRGVHMTREKFIKLTGWAMILGAFLFMVGWLAANRPEYNQYNAASLPIDRFANLAGIPLAALGLVLISLGLLGMLLRYGSKAGGSRLWLGLGAVSGLVSAVGAVWMGVDDSGPGWYLFFLGLFFQFSALALFGVVNLRHRLLPRWNGLPLLAGVWLPGIILLSGLFELTTGTMLDSPQAVFNLLWLFSLLMIAGLGYLLQSDPAALSAAS